MWGHLEGNQTHRMKKDDRCRRQEHGFLLWPIGQILLTGLLRARKNRHKTGRCRAGSAERNDYRPVCGRVRSALHLGRYASLKKRGREGDICILVQRIGEQMLDSFLGNFAPNAISGKMREGFNLRRISPSPSGRLCQTRVPLRCMKQTLFIECRVTFSDMSSTLLLFWNAAVRSEKSCLKTNSSAFLFGDKLGWCLNGIWGFWSPSEWENLWERTREITFM